MSALGTQLAQVRPSGTTSATAFKLGSSARLKTEITKIFVANTTGAAATYRLFHDDDGGTFDESTALVWDATVGIGEFKTIPAESENAGIVMSPGACLGVRSSVTSALTFTFYGVSQQGR